MVWNRFDLQTTPNPTGLLNRPMQRPVITVHANGNGAGVTMSGHSTAVAIDGTATQFKDATGQYQNITGDSNRNGWRQTSELSPVTGIQYTARMKSPAALPVAAGVGRWVYGCCVDGFEDANPSTVEGFAFRMDRTAGNTTWWAVVRGPVAEQSVDTGVAFGLNTRFDFAITQLTSGVTFLLNDVRVAQFTSDLPAQLLQTFAQSRSNGVSADCTVRNAFWQVIWNCNA